MLSRLAFRSFKKQVRSYLIYFLCMVLAVAIFYCFNTLTYDQALVYQANQDIRLEYALNLGQWIVIAILLFFMLSANRFFLSRRSEEIGIYQLFGLKKWKIILLFVVETMVLGGCSLVAGIFLGVLVSKLFSMILVKAMALNVASVFFISWRSIGLTTLVIFSLLALVSLRTSWLVSRADFSSLFQEEELDSQKFRSTFGRKALGIGGILLLVAGYGCAVHSQPLIDFLTPRVEGLGAYFLSMFFPFVLCVLGTYLFFGWSLKLITWLLNRRKKIRNRDLNALMLGDINSYLVRNWKTSAAITVIMSIAILLISLAVSLFSFSLTNILYTEPVSFQLAKENYPAFLELLNQKEGQLEEVQELNFKVIGGYYGYEVANQQSPHEIRIVNLLSYSNYNDYRKMNSNLSAIHFDNDEEAVLFDQQQNTLKDWVHYDSTITIPDVHLTVIDSRPDYLGLDSLRYSGVTLVVPDKVFQQAQGVSYAIKAVNATVKDEDDFANVLSQKLDTQWIDPIAYDYQWVEGLVVGHIQRISSSEVEAESAQVRLNFSSQYSSWRVARRQTGLVVYVSAFIGLISLITAASILSLRQLSEATRNRRNYHLLFVLGIKQSKLQRLIYWENALVFLPVMLITITNSYYGIYYLSQHISTPNFWLPSAFIGILILIYLLFYLMTVVFYRHTVKV